MQPPDLISLFVAPLNRLELPYMVTGAVAAIAYGEPRLTNDIDIVLALTDRDAARVHDAFAGADRYVPPVEIIAAEASRPLDGHFNIIHAATALKADIYPAGEDPMHRWALSVRRRITMGEEPVWLAPPEYVVVRKLQYLRQGGSDKHRRDIEAMVRTLGDALDRATLTRYIERLGLGAEWKAVIGS